MKKRTIQYAGILASLVFVVANACKYDEVLPLEPDPGIQISFSEDIIPIFNASCNQSGCHNGGGPSPDLRASVAFASLWEGGYIDTTNAENSELYLWMTGARGLPMPIEGVNASYVSTVVQWIHQGALNN